jgi:hypothetical protein
VIIKSHVRFRLSLIKIKETGTKLFIFIGSETKCVRNETVFRHHYTSFQEISCFMQPENTSVHIKSKPVSSFVRQFNQMSGYRLLPRSR